ncbi:MAG: amidohydrolase family protein, partial [bacterium]
GRQYRKWADTLSKEVTDIAKELVETYDKDGIDLYVNKVLDYEYWFESTYDSPVRYQIDYVYKKIHIPYRGKIHSFVPFDPARELAFENEMLDPDGKMEILGSLALVDDAIKNKGYIGVKVYNSLGYKPFHNASVDHLRRKRIKPHKKWGYDVFKGEDYDRVLAKLYDYCVENDVPITAHCVMEGIESYHNASYHFGKAIFWRDVLKTWPALRVNLAHFGWGRLGYHWKNSWVKDICKMMTKYDNLYVDTACHGILTKQDSQRFKSDYESMRRDLSDFRGRNFWTEIKKRILFGIDWHVIKRKENFEHFMERYIEILKHNNLFSDKELEDFLGGNALRFLGVLPGGQNRDRLLTFYKKHNIKKPKWFI